MSAVFAIIVFIALNLVPQGVDVFQIVDPAGGMVNGQPVEKVIEFAKQPDGKWRVVDLPRDPFGTYAFNGKTLTVTPPEDEQKRGSAKPMTMDMANVISVGDGTDWATVSEVMTVMTKSGGKATLSRQPGQVTVDIVASASADAKPHTFLIRWTEKKTE